MKLAKVSRDKQFAMASWPKKSFRGTLNIRPKGWKSYVEEVLARATSIKDAIDHLRQGTVLWKIRDKGIRGLVIYKRKYRLDMAELRIHYTPNKMITGKNCTAGGPGSMPAIDLGDIAEIRAGHSTDTFNTLGKQNKTLSDGRLVIDNVNCHRDFCFSIVFNDDTAPLDLVADNETTRDLWINALTHLVVTIKSLGQQKEYELFLRKQFKKADKNGNGALNLKECHDLIEQLNIKMSLDELRGLFKAANFIKAKGNEEEALDEAEFVTFYYSLLKRPELDEVFIRYATKEGPRMSPEDLLKFLTVEQQMEMTTEEVEKMIDAFEPTADKSTLSNEGFTHFMMFSDWQEITDPAKRLVYQDMNQPLSHYWIAASHNTYLMGNQVTGESSVDAYIKALKEGCRCVELDCWDGSDGEPIIYHGWTLTSKISFEEVMRDAIKPYAFHSSDYPLILSIENHCSIEQQDKMADHMKAILGDSLFTDPTDDEKNELPSPEALKHKILVKGKKLPPGQSQGDDIDEDDNDDDDVEDLDEKRKEKAKGKEQKKTEKLSQKLSDCVNYVEAVHFHGFDDQAKYYHMSSFGETKAFKFLESAESAKQLVRYNSRQISRIYPGAKRQDSSNLKVIPPWNAGCQIVALNYQTEDKQNFINRARFADNGACGYVLKPDFLRDASIRYSPISPCELNSKSYPAWKIDVTIVSGQHIPKADGQLEGEVIDPYVKVRLRGHIDDEREEAKEGEERAKKNRGKTRHVANNGFNPVWKEKFHFESKVPQLAFLEFRVKDHSKSGADKDLGAFCSPLKCIQNGYRRVPLKRYSGKDLTPASLLVHIHLVKPKPEV